MSTVPVHRAVRRALAGGVAGALALTLAACGGEEKPSAEPTEVDTAIPLPTATGKTDFEGQGLSQVQLSKIAKTMSTALQEGDEKSFLSFIATGQAKLVDQQRQWFRNVRRMPMSQREVVVVRPDDDIDSSGKATLTALVGLKHKITGADSKPVTEWYSYGFKRQKDKSIRIVSVGGAPAAESSGQKFSRYYRQPWDDPGTTTFVQDDKVVIIGSSGDEAAMRRMLPTISAGTRAAVDRFVKSGFALESDTRSRKWVYFLAHPSVSDFFDYLGGRVDQREANFAGFANPVMASSDANNESLDYEEGVATTRIVLNRSVLGYSSASLSGIVRHEMTHAVEQQWEDAFFGNVPRWVTEGFAMYMADAPQKASDAAAGRRGLAGAKAMPSIDVFYAGSNDRVSQNYGMGYLGVAYLVDKVGLKKVIAAIKATSSGARKDFFTEVGVPQKGFVAAVRGWAS